MPARKTKMKEALTKVFSVVQQSTSSTTQLINSTTSVETVPAKQQQQQQSSAQSALLHALDIPQHYRTTERNQVYKSTTERVHSNYQYDRVPTGDYAPKLGHDRNRSCWNKALRILRRLNMSGDSQLGQNMCQAFESRGKDKNGSIQAGDDAPGGPSRLGPQVMAALSVSLGSLVVGFASAYTSPAGASMVSKNMTLENSTATANVTTWEAENTFLVTEKDTSLIGGILPLAALVGGAVGGPLIDVLGRKSTILATAIPFIVSWLLIGLATNLYFILAGRALAGFCVGLASLALPVYLGETVQPEVRGTLGLLPTAFGNTGILLAYSAGMFLNWWKLALLGALVPIPFLILLCIIPETPSWYFSKERPDKARTALQWLRGRDADIEREFGEVEKNVAKNKQSGTSISTLLKKQYLKPVAITIGLMFFQQFSGVNAVIFYTVQIFRDVGSTLDGNVCTIIVGCVNFASTFLATTVIDRMGRKLLLYVSAVAMTITLSTLGAYMYIKDHTSIDVSAFSYIPLLSFVFYIIGFSFGFGPIPWLMMGEILPSKIRGPAASVATAINWACTSVITFTFQDLMAGIGPAYTFWMFAIICFLAFFFVLFAVPETRGKSLEDIERKFAGRQARRMSSIANLRPSPMAV